MTAPILVMESFEGEDFSKGVNALPVCMDRSSPAMIHHNACHELRNSSWCMKKGPGMHVSAGIKLLLVIKISISNSSIP
jgi:hypothetical protein